MLLMRENFFFKFNYKKHMFNLYVKINFKILSI